MEELACATDILVSKGLYKGICIRLIYHYDLIKIRADFASRAYGDDRICISIFVSSTVHVYGVGKVSVYMKCSLAVNEGDGGYAVIKVDECKLAVSRRSISLGYVYTRFAAHGQFVRAGVDDRFAHETQASVDKDGSVLRSLGFYDGYVFFVEIHHHNVSVLFDDQRNKIGAYDIVSVKIEAEMGEVSAYGQGIVKVCKKGDHGMKHLSGYASIDKANDPIKGILHLEVELCRPLGISVAACDVVKLCLCLRTASKTLAVRVKVFRRNNVHIVRHSLFAVGVDPSTVTFEPVVNLICFCSEYGKCVHGLAVVNVLTESVTQKVRNLAACKLCGGLGGGNLRHILSCVAQSCVADAVLGSTIAVLGTVAQIVAVLHDAVITSNHAADKFVAADRTGIVAVLYGAAVVLSNHAADIIHADDGALVVAVLYGAKVISNHAADIIISVKIGIDHSYVLHLAVRAYVAEQTHVVYGAIIEIQAAYGLAVSVEDAGVSVRVITDGSPQSEARGIGEGFCHFGKDALVDYDIFGQNGVRTCILRRAVGQRTVHQCRKPIQLACVVDLVVAVAVRVGCGLI